MKVERIFDGALVEPPSGLPSAEWMTRQLIFDRVVRHYRAHPRRCVSDVTGRCCYRLGRDRCFAGALIDDAHYDRKMEGYTVFALAAHFSMPAWFHDNIDFIEALQNLHDDVKNWPRMEMALELFAVARGLAMPA
jgi:hypothetical protein